MRNGTVPTETLRVLGIAGSLRAGSYNRRLIDAAAELAPDGMAVETYPLDEIPLFNADLESDAPPEPVARFRQAVDAADALLIATPEYNHSIPGVLKNALDWASRPPTLLDGTPVGMMGASPGAIGAARAQLHLETILLALRTRLMPHRGVLVGGAMRKFSEDGRLRHEPTRRFLSDYLEQFERWARRGLREEEGARAVA